MVNYRVNKISEETRRIIDEIIREDMRDPRIIGTFAVTRADVTRDLRHAKVYVSVLEEEFEKPFIQALEKAAGFIRNELGRRLQLRYTPELHFVLDKNIEYGIYMNHRIDEVLKAQEESRGEDDNII